ncbi:hypothetical protein R69658_07482 [Paraburkholderia aspalathi]|uniref:Uncharacterized protein n=1 Tax=Paraburkholderia aspalathi TaxID=1324617 RepID=A0ABN7N701_9BURK|nr:hypothetical protein R69658_07482 [Paraburkholderia aspalathi]
MTTGASSPPFYFVLRTSFSLLIAPSTYVLMLNLGAQIADLAKTSRTVVSDDDNNTDEWDFDIDDFENTPSAVTESGDPMTAAIGQLNQALRDHVTTLAQDANAKVSLVAVLDGLSDETKGVQWRPLGVLIDVQA